MNGKQYDDQKIVDQAKISVIRMIKCFELNTILFERPITVDRVVSQWAIICEQVSPASVMSMGILQTTHTCPCEY